MDITDKTPSGRVACAYYDPVKYTIYVFDDTPENQHYDLTKARKTPNTLQKMY